MKRAAIFTVIILAAVIRLVGLEAVPPSLNGDEAAIGYNAFSIAQTGTDEHGEFLPLSFRSFGDFKAPLYIYLTSFWIWLLGVSEVAIRLTSALAGFLTVALIYGIGQELFSRRIGFLAALFLAISPWHIQFSRGAYEANLGLFLVTLGVYLFLAGGRNFRLLPFSAFFFGLSLYAYHAPRLAVPLLVLALVALFWKKIKNASRQLSFALVTLFLLGVPIAWMMLAPAGQSRFVHGWILGFWDAPTKFVALAPESGRPEDVLSLLGDFLFHNRGVFFLSDVASKFYAYFSPAILFVEGDPVGRHGVVDMGMLYFFDVLLLALVFYFLATRKLDKKIWFLLFWLLVGILPAALLRDKFHALRLLQAAPPLYLLEAWGVDRFLSKIDWRKNLIWRFGLVAFALLVGVSFSRYLDNYFLVNWRERAYDYQYGYKQMVEQALAHRDEYREVVVDAPELYGNPYIFFLLYQAYDPRLYQEEARYYGITESGVIHVAGFDKFTFRGIYWPDDRFRENTLFIGKAFSIPKSDLEGDETVKLIQEITLPNGEVVARVVGT